MANELAKRVAVAAVGIPLAVAVLYYGGWILAALLSIICVIGSFELARIARAKEVYPSAILMAVFSIAFIALAAALPNPVRSAPWFWFLTTLLAIVSLTMAIWTRGVEGKPLSSAAVTVFGTILLGGTLSYAMFLRQSQSVPRDGLLLVFYPLAVTWINDTFAYFGGRTFGKHKMIPHVSPGKTWEGTFSGMVGAVLTSMLYSRIVFENTLDMPIPIYAAGIAGVVLSIAAVVGDLAESLLKREAGVKDSGTLLPGHGGVLDRFDALFFTIPVAFWFIVLMLAMNGGSR
ncbi:MAG TPA: phosphatidate cytidylyltransferase [Longimicrobiales bacterium]|nr:phosphatidate cytidylyltransferase [Longimicrobiales bacterium]